MTITVTGTLKRDAETYLGANGNAIVVLLVDRERGMPFEGHRDFGTRPEDMLTAQAWAAKHRRGEACVMTGEAARIRTDHGVAAIVLTGGVTYEAAQ